MDISKKVLILGLLMINNASSTNLPNLGDQTALFNGILQESWRDVTISHNNQSTPIANYLIDTIKNHNNSANNLLNIVNDTPLSVSTPGESDKFWKKSYEVSLNETMKKVFIGNYNSYSDTYFWNTPRTQQEILNRRELLRFKINFDPSNSSIISHSNFEKDDIIRALSLSGTFCSLSSNTLEPIFSGMLFPDQFNNSPTYTIHSCLHGFLGETIQNVYFVPYGINLANGLNANFDGAFQVDSIWKKSSQQDEINQIALNTMTIDSAYNQEDYIMVKIKGQTSCQNSKDLCQVLQERQNSNIFNEVDLFPGFMQQDQNLPNFKGNEQSYDEKFNNFQLQVMPPAKFFVIGRPSDPRYQLNDSGFAIVTNLTDQMIFNPDRSLHDDSTTQNPLLIGHYNQIASDFPSIHGMSGGIVLKSFIDESSNVIQRVARPIGTDWGTERRFESNEFVALNAFINLIN